MTDDSSGPQEQYASVGNYLRDDGAVLVYVVWDGDDYARVIDPTAARRLAHALLEAANEADPEGMN